MRASRLLLLLLAAALIGFSIFGVLVYRAVDVERADGPEALRRFSAARAAVGDETPMLEVDGGVARATIGRLAAAGADTFVAGHAVFTAADPAEEVRTLRRLAEAAATGRTHG